MPAGRATCQNRPMRRWVKAVAVVALLTPGGILAELATSPSTARAATPPTTGSGPASKYDCKLTATVAADAFTGAYGTASAIGWEGNQQGVVTCLGGTFVVQDGIYQDFGFGIYNGAPTTWTDADGYLPAQITTFSHSGADGLHHRVRRPGGARRRRLRRRLQPGRRPQPDRPCRRGRPEPVRRAGAARHGARRRGSPHDGRPRLRRGRRPLRAHLPVAQCGGAGRRGQLRPALRPHAALLEPAAGRHRRRQRPRRLARRSPTGAASSTPRSPAAATSSTPGSTATRASTATTSSAS